MTRRRLVDVRDRALLLLAFASGVPPVGNTVDLANATWKKRAAPELVAVWPDSDFDPAQSAFYYGRVLEIPTPRWTADASTAVQHT